MKYLIIVVLLWGSFISWSQTDLKNSVTEFQMDSLFADWDHLDRPGIAVGVVSNGEVVLTKGYGSANLEHQVAITPQTKFLVSELANQFVSFSLLLLEDQGKLSLKDNVNKYLPDLPSWSKDVTLEQLLHHTSGINDLESIKEITGWHVADLINDEQTYDLISKQTNFVTSPGANHQFNPTGMFLLEEVIASVTNMPYAQYVTENIFTPLEMTNSIFSSTPGTIIKGKATGYFRTSDGFEKPIVPYPFANQAHLYSTIEDMCKWLKNFHSLKIGSKAILEKFDQAVLQNGKEMPEVNIAMKVGQHRYWNFFGTKKLYLVGMSGGYSCKLIRFPDYDFGCVVLGNTRSYNGYMGSSASSLYVDKYFTTDQRVVASKEQVVSNVSTAELKKYTGYYWNESSYLTRRVILKNDTLRYVRVGRDFESTLLPMGENQFFMSGQDGVTISFNPDKNGARQMVFSSDTGEPTSVMKYYDPDALWTRSLKEFLGTYYSDKLDTYYTVSLEGKDLNLTHTRRSRINLMPNLKDSFGSDNYFFSKILFIRGKDFEVESLTIEHPGIENIQFVKVSGQKDDS